MCRRYPIARSAAVVWLAAMAWNNAGFAQTAQRGAIWVRVGNTGVAKSLAGLAGGGVLGVWYSANGDRLFVRTESGRVFESSDFEHWQLNQSDPSSAELAPNSSASQFRLGERNLYVSHNDGLTWINLTGINGTSLVGTGADVLASNPQNSSEIAIGNAFGLWRSADGGLTWIGLNEKLPNLPATRLLDSRTVLLKDGSAASWGTGAWLPRADLTAGAAANLELRLKATPKLNIEVQSAALGKDGWSYAGSVDGRIFVSRDGGAKWLESPRVNSIQAPVSAVQRFWIDPDRPEAALAIAGNRLLRTVNGGGFWDDVTGSMPSFRLNAVAADRSASIIYAATDRGVYSARLSLNDAGAPSNSWGSVSGELPAAPVLDILYNLDGTLTAALDGYGVFEALAPHKSQTVRLLSGADLTERAAAPGSLVSVIGAQVKSASGGDLVYPVLAASEAATQLQVPFESQTGVITLALQSGNQRLSLPLTIKENAPAIFVDSDGAPLLTDSDSGLVIDPKTALRAGQRVQMMATGLGKVFPDWPTGTPGPVEAAPSVRGTVTAFLDGMPLEVTRAVLAAGYVGYYTVELQLPQIMNRGANELVLLMNGERSNRVKVFLEPAPL